MGVQLIQVRILSGLLKVRLEVGNPPEERSSFGGVKSENKWLSENIGSNPILTTKN